MADRPLYAYRLDVTYPAGSHDAEGHPIPGWEPPGWSDNPDNHFYSMEESGVREFTWPPAKPYVSRGGAARRAQALRKYGATVRIVRSDPITWPGDV